MVEDHMVACFTRTGGVYCMVATCPRKTLELDEIRRLMRKHQGDLIEPRRDASVALLDFPRQR
jgi:hypothetical protein